MDALKRPARYLACMALALLAAGPARAAEPLAERSDLTQDARGIATLDIQNARGQVSVRPSSDGLIHVHAVKIARGSSAQAARRLAASTTVEAGSAGGVYRVEVHYPHRIDMVVNFWDLFSDEDNAFRPRLEVRLDIEIPAAVALAANTASGDLQSTGVQGTQRIHTASGDIVVLGARGPVEIETASGDVRIEGAASVRVGSASGDIDVVGAASLDAHSASGDIHAGRIRQGLKLRSASGDVHVDEAPAGIDAESVSGELRVEDAGGSVRLVTASGNVGLRLRGAIGPCDVGSTSGEVTLSLPGSVDADLSLETASGDMECDLPVRLLDHSPTRMLARCGRGGTHLRLHTASGDIHVTNHGD